MSNVEAIRVHTVDEGHIATEDITSKCGNASNTCAYSGTGFRNICCDTVTQETTSRCGNNRIEDSAALQVIYRSNTIVASYGCGSMTTHYCSYSLTTQTKARSKPAAFLQPQLLTR